VVAACPRLCKGERDGPRGVSHHALLQWGHWRGLGGLLPFFAGLLAPLRGCRAIHSWPHRSHRNPGTLIVISAMRSTVAPSVYVRKNTSTRLLSKVN
jgi:hypothetical protein